MKRLLFALLTAVLVLTALSGASLVGPQPDSLPDGALTLRRPVFVDTAWADEAHSTAIGDKLDGEAGISAYLEAGTSINLGQVRPLFRTIEAETTDYIIGSIEAPNYNENYDVHVYVHKDGWILTYYLKEDPASKIVDVRASTLEPNLLKTVLGTVAGTAGVPLVGINYYDFRYPNATNILMVGEDEANGNDFQITLPQEYAYLELGWSLADVGFSSQNCFKIDDTDKFPDADYWDGEYYGGYAYGGAELSELLPGSSHRISVCRTDFGALLIVYRVP